MKIMKLAFASWVVVMTLLAIWAVRNLRDKPITEARTFCAYGRIFVEFEEDGKVWGTILLDNHGKPVPCKEEETIQLSNTI